MNPRLDCTNRTLAVEPKDPRAQAIRCTRRSRGLSGSDGSELAPPVVLAGSESFGFLFPGGRTALVTSGALAALGRSTSPGSSSCRAAWRHPWAITLGAIGWGAKAVSRPTPLRPACRTRRREAPMCARLLRAPRRESDPLSLALLRSWAVERWPLSDDVHHMFTLYNALGGITWARSVRLSCSSATRSAVTSLPSQARRWPGACPGSRRCAGRSAHRSRATGRQRRRNTL